MAFTFHIGASIAIASALAMAVLGMLVLRLGSQHGSALTFAAFVLAWSAQILAANTTALWTDPAIVHPAALVFQALLLVACVPLLVFAFTYPPSREELLPRPWAWTLLGAPAIAAILVMVYEPTLFVEDVRDTGGIAAVTFGDLSGFTSGAFLASFLAGTSAIAYRLHRSRRREERARLALLLSAFVLYVSYQGGSFVGWVGPRRDVFLASRGPLGYGVIVALLGLLFLASLSVLVWAWRTPDLPWRGLLLPAASVPLLVTIGEDYLQATTTSTFGTVGVWRIGMVAILAYAIARYRLFDLEVQLRDAVPVGSYVALFGVGLAVVWGGFGDVFGQAWWAGLGATIGVAACAWPSMNLAEDLLDRYAGHLEDPAYLSERKLEVYRSALEDALAEGMDAEEQRFLADLRDRLGISQDEHDAMMAVLGTSQDRTGTGLREDRFEILAELGRGSLGRALLARDEQLEREVVLKEATGSWLFDEEGRELFMQEARLAAQLNHPHVVQIYDVLPHRRPPTLVIEHVPGGSLDERIREEGPLAPAEAVDLLVQALDGLEAIHEQGIVHRDLKPANVLLTAEGQAKVTDLGVARPPERLQADPTLVTTGDQPGTLVYTSPEQIRGEAVDVRSDVYAAGATLHFALTGESYLGDLDGGSPAVRRRVRDQAPALDDEGIPDRLGPVLARALAKRPDDRYARAAEMRADLVDLRAELGSPAAEG